MTTTASGLLYKITKSNPEGKAPKAGDMVSVHYAGKLTNGQEFDNFSKEVNLSKFQSMLDQVIKGWDEGIQLLKEGEAATLLIPSELGYGTRGAGRCNSTKCLANLRCGIGESKITYSNI